jgi:hypothetical protein
VIREPKSNENRELAQLNNARSEHYPLEKKQFHPHRSATPSIINMKHGREPRTSNIRQGFSVL